MSKFFKNNYQRHLCRKLQRVQRLLYHVYRGGNDQGFFLVCIVTLCLGNDQNWDNCDVLFHVNTPAVNTSAKALYYLAQSEQLKDTFMDKIVVMLYCLNPFEKVDTLY